MCPEGSWDQTVTYGKCSAGDSECRRLQTGRAIWGTACAAGAGRGCGEQVGAGPPGGGFAREVSGVAPEKGPSVGWTARLTLRVLRTGQRGPHWGRGRRWAGRDPCVRTAAAAQLAAAGEGAQGTPLCSEGRGTAGPPQQGALPCARPARSCSLRDLSRQQQERALAAVLADTLWASGAARKAVVCLVTADTCVDWTPDHSRDGFTERVSAVPPEAGPA